MYINVETITPEKAREYLKLNHSNRPISHTWVATLAREIQNDHFLLTHQGIAFDQNGFLIDGQHRLSACVLANKPIEIMVSRDVVGKKGIHDGLEISPIDIGRKRTANDIFSMEQFYEENPAFRHKGTIAVARSLIRFGYNAHITPSVFEIAKLYAAIGKEFIAIYNIYILKPQSNSAVGAAAVAAMLNGETEENIKKFFAVFVNSDIQAADGLNVFAPMNLARQFLEMSQRRGAYQKGALYNLAQNAIYRFIHSSESSFIRQTKKPRYPVDELVRDILFNEEEKK